MINEMASKLDKFKNENKILKKELVEMKKIPLLAFNYKGDIIYIKKASKFYHIEIPGIPKNNCQVCGKRRKTKAHHLIPKRAKAVNKILKELRVKVCRECDRINHPENLIDGKGIIDRLNRAVTRRNQKIDRLKNRKDDVVIKYIEKRIGKLEKEVKKLHIQLKDTPRKIHPAQKQVEGRIFELRHIIKNYKNILNGKPIEREEYDNNN